MTADPEMQCKLIREAVSGYVSEETDVEKLSYLRNALVALVGTEADRHALLFGTQAPEDTRTDDPRVSDTSDVSETTETHHEDPAPGTTLTDDLPQSVRDYLDPSPEEPAPEEVIGESETPTGETVLQESSPHEDKVAESEREEESPVRRISPLAPRESAQEVPQPQPTSDSEVKATKQEPTKDSSGEETSVTPAPAKQSFGPKHTPFQEAIDAGTYKTPYRTLASIKKALRTLGFGDEQFAVIDAAIAYKGDDPKNIYTLFVDRAFTLPLTYGEIKQALEQAKVRIPTVRYSGWRTFEEKYKLRACWYVWSRMRDAMDAIKQKQESEGNKQ